MEDSNAPSPISRGLFYNGCGDSGMTRVNWMVKHTAQQSCGSLYQILVENLNIP